MSRLSRPLTLVAAVVIATSGVAACSGSQPTSSVPGSGGPTASGLPGPSLISNLPALGLKNVTTETAAARGLVVTQAGGTIMATGSNGAIYTLAIPPDAMPATTQIAIYPISRAANLPGGISVSAGVQITPDGIQLRRPATFTIEFPSGVDPKGLGGLLWTGDADKVHAFPMSVQGQTVTMHLFHFTAPVVTPDPLPDITALGPGCTDADAMDSLIGFDVSLQKLSLRLGALTDALRDCYHHYVAPALQSALANPLDGGRRVEALEAADHWLYGLADAASAVGSQAFTVSPEVSDAKATATTLAQAWYEAENKDCIAHKDDPDLDVPISAASNAIFLGWDFAHEWGVDTAANGLELEPLLDGLCVQVVIDPRRSYSATEPGTTGDVTVNAGITIAGGPLRFEPTHVTLTRTGTGAVSAEGRTDTRGDFTAAVPWPTGVDPMQIDIRAELDSPGTEFGTGIARFDRITKHPGEGPKIALPPPAGSLKIAMFAGASAGFGQGTALDLPVVGTCQVFRILARTAQGELVESGQATVSGQATPLGGGMAGSSDGGFVAGATPGTVTITVTDSRNGTITTGSRTFYVDALGGQYMPAAQGLPQVFVQGLIDSEGILSYEVRFIGDASDIGLDVPSDDWLLVADGNRLHGVGPSTTPIDVTIDGAHLKGTIGDTTIDLVRDWRC